MSTPNRWPGRAIIVVALATGTLGVALALASRGVVDLILSSGLRALLEGGRSADHYASWLRATAAAWAVLVPLLLLVGDGLRHTLQRGRATSPAMLRLLLATALATLLVAALVPRHRTGDEPAYLGMAASLWRDADLRVPELGDELHPSPAARDGARSVHGVGMAWLLAAPQGLLGGPGVALLTAALGIATALVLRRLLTAELREPVATTITVIAAVSFPLLPFAGLAFPDLAAALCIGILYLRIVRGRGRPVAVAVAVALLPWLNPRTVPPALVLALAAFAFSADRRRALRDAVAPLIASLVAMAWFHLRWFGSPSPFAMRHGETGVFDVARLVAGAPGTWFDQQYGVLWWAPLLWLLPFGAMLWWRRRPRRWLLDVTLLAAALGPGLAHQWWGGWSPAGRFLVPLVVPLWLWVGIAFRALGATRSGVVGRSALIAAQWAIGAVAALVPTKLFGTFEAAPRNYIVATLDRLTGLRLADWLPMLRGQESPLLLAFLWAALLTWIGLSAAAAARWDRDASCPAVNRRLPTVDRAGGGATPSS